MDNWDLGDDLDAAALWERASFERRFDWRSWCWFSRYCSTSPKAGSGSLLWASTPPTTAARVTVGTDEIEEDAGIEEEEREEEESVETTKEGVDVAEVEDDWEGIEGVFSDRGLFKDWIGVGRGAWRWV